MIYFHYETVVAGNCRDGDIFTARHIGAADGSGATGNAPYPE